MPHTPPPQPKIYHILHVDRLSSVLADGCLYADAVMVQRQDAGTCIGMGHIKQRRLTLPISSHPGLRVGDCVPFYFCPRSVMLYIISKGNNPDLAYRGGQAEIVHLEADLRTVVNAANADQKRWAFTLSNAGSGYFEDRASLTQLGEINWPAVQATSWQKNRDAKQAEFLLENALSWSSIENIGVHSAPVLQKVQEILRHQTHKPAVNIKKEWYY